MKAKIKSIYSLDIDDLPNYKPFDPENFHFLLRVIACPESEEGEESFDIQVCTPKWLLENHKPEDVIIGRHYLIVMEYNYDRIIQTINSFCSQCEGSTWEEVAHKLGRLGYWEFEDYREYEAGQA